MNNCLDCDGGAKKYLHSAFLLLFALDLSEEYGRNALQCQDCVKLADDSLMQDLHFEALILLQQIIRFQLMFKF